MKTVQALCVGLAALALAGCGRGAPLGGGKQGAAQAAFQAGSAGRGAQGGLLQLLQQNIGNVNITTTVNGDKGGKATVTESVNVTGSSTAIVMSIQYQDFSEDGHNKYNGNWTITLNTTTSGAGQNITGAVSLEMKGALTISGDISDNLSGDVTENINFSDLSSGSSVSITLTGTLTDSSGTYNYNNDSFAFSVSADLPKGP